MSVLLWELMFDVDVYSIKANIGRHENAFWFHSYKNQIFRFFGNLEWRLWSQKVICLSAIRSSFFASPIQGCDVPRRAIIG